MAGIDFRAVAAAVTCRDFADRYMELRGGRARCPFHGGHDFNLAFNRDGRCHCYVCMGDGARDVVGLAAAVWGTSQLDAAKRLNQEYGLQIAEGMTVAEREHARRVQDRKAAEQRIAASVLADARAEMQTAVASGDENAIRMAGQWLRLKECEAARGCAQ